MFAALRNKTRGHGAPTPAMCAKLVPTLKNAIQLLSLNNPVFSMPWAYLHRNLSGKYRVMEIGGDQDAFGSLKSSAAIDGKNYPNGIYLFAGGYRRVELLHADLDVSDFLSQMVLSETDHMNCTHSLRITDSKGMRHHTSQSAASAPLAKPRAEANLKYWAKFGRTYLHQPSAMFDGRGSKMRSAKRL